MRKVLKKLARSLGYDIVRRSAKPIDTFEIQAALVGSKQNPIIFDVGAHIGGISSVYRRIFPSGEIHAFEPFNESFAVLEEAFLRDKHHHCHRLALSDQAGQSTFHANTKSYTNSLLPTHKSAEAFWGEAVRTADTVLVQTDTLDAFCERSNIRHIDILKLDVQGAEVAILRGAESLLRAKAIGIIYTEIIVAPTYQRQGRIDELFGLLYARGYRLFDLADLVKCGMELAQMDALFVLA